MVEGINREHKDRLFTFIFGREENKKWTLELYNAINGTDYSNEDDIEINTIDDVLYMGMKNDVSFLLGSFLSLYEQQSTYNPNMPVRDLMYLGKLYDKYIHGHRLNIYGKHRIKLPVPKLVTFYNGTEQHEDGILKLTDLFDEEYRMHSDVEVRVRMININPGHNEELVKACRPLFEYSWLIDSIRNNRQKMEIKEAVDKALRDMPGDFVIREFVELNRAEVTNMCLTEYNEAETMEMLKEEAREEGRSEGIKEGKSQTADDVLRAISKGATVEEIQQMLTREK
ncbi:hypothetical protein QYZ88_010245 [Lachnospiraceae bacterium C1.1]|nr:hypothetical protein [Lachnospiraceae bacterium C1.1]